MKSKQWLLGLVAAGMSVWPAQARLTHVLPTPKSVWVNAEAQDVRLTGGVEFLTAPSERVAAAFRNLLGQTAVSEPGAPLVRIVTGAAVPGAYDYPLAGFPDEAYRLAVGNDTIHIEAATETGVIRAVQTLAQMAEGWDGEQRLEASTVADWPAFKLRGWMHDVGRSYISVEELKREIRLLGRFKVNTFHWHLTENQAWRFEVKAFPQLTSAASMTRFAGKYYTQEQCREVVRLAAEYGISVIPEIDMPGHSKAFERAMGHSMQTDQGLSELKQILDEVCEVFADAPYVHIGADEQQITYPGFLRTITDYIHQKGMRVVVWNPISGVTITTQTGADMTQMWSTAGKAVGGLPNIDCRYNYVNHFDVFADLVGIYKSNVYYAWQGSADVAGEITAVWNDRYVEDERSIVQQNNLYANVLAATERAWKGGGRRYIESGGTVLPNAGEEYEEFADWERRFLFHKAHSLREEPIAYVRQADVRWQITEAFPNGGNAAMAFPPETEGPKDTYLYDGQVYTTGLATGAGIYLRHTWGTTVPGYYAAPQLNTTAYAWTYVYSPTAQEAGALIEFQNYGRSENDKAPERGKWDRKGSRLWLNDVEIKAPAWANAGKTISSEVPLKDENFTARQPVKIQLREGWNKVFLKLPYVGADGVRLNKWMFTFVITDTEGRDALEGLVYSPHQQFDEDYSDDEQALMPQLSDERYAYWYTLCTPLRNGRYVQSNGVGAGLTGGTDGKSAKAMWKFAGRDDGSMDIVNRNDASYISPTAASNTQLKTSKARPSRGWTLQEGETEGYLIITSGTTQMNQTNPSLNYQVYNWGSGTNTTDTGCQFAIRMADVTDGIASVPADSGAPWPLAAYDLTGRPANGSAQQGVVIVEGKKYLKK